MYIVLLSAYVVVVVHPFPDDGQIRVRFRRRDNAADRNWDPPWRNALGKGSHSLQCALQLYLFPPFPLSAVPGAYLDQILILFKGSLSWPNNKSL